MIIILIYDCVYVCLCYPHVGTLRGQKRVCDALELELQAVVSYPVWVLGTKLESSGRALRALND